MKRLLGVSISQRLSIAFSAVILLFAASMLMIKQQQKRSAAAQDELTTRVVPRSTASWNLEREVLLVGIGVRGYVINPTRERLLELQGTMQRVRDALATLDRIPKGDDGNQRYTALVAPVLRYLGTADSIAAAKPTFSADVERELILSRLTAVEAVHAFNALQALKSDDAIRTLGDARERESVVLTTSVLLAMAVMLAVAVFTTTSVKRATAELVELADTMQQGDWQRAITWTRAHRLPNQSARFHEFEQIGHAFSVAGEAIESREREKAAAFLEVQEQREQVQAQNEELQAQAEEIQAQNEELQAQSEEIQAQNAQLITQTEQLRLADTHKNDFLGLLAHELRNPLAAVSNSVFLLSSLGSESPVVDRARTIIDRQTRQLTRLIDDLLDVTRIARGKLRLERAPVDVCDVLRENIADLRGSFERRQVAVQVNCPGDAAPVLADRSRLSQIFGNLLENATKFTESGGTVVVTVQRNATDVHIAIADSGIGIDPALIPKLFQPFVQADLSRTRTASGLGLGLSLVHAYVSMHDGKIELHSDGPGTGTTVKLEFPLIPPAAADDATNSDVTHSDLANSVEVREASVDSATLTRMRVLVVEDNPDAAETLRDALTVSGHDVQLAANAMSGLQRAREFQPELILCDVGMPIVDGYEFARRVRSDPSLAHAYVVALTGYAMPEDRERAAVAGFDQHLTKPAPIEQLRAAVRLAATRRESAGGATGAASGARGNV